MRGSNFWNWLVLVNELKGWGPTNPQIDSGEKERSTIDDGRREIARNALFLQGPIGGVFCAAALPLVEAMLRGVR